MLDDVRGILHHALNSDLGDSFLIVRLQKRVARRVHKMLGSPLAPRANPPATAPKGSAARAQPAPVMIYYEKDRNIRELTKIRDTLGARDIPYQLLDVSSDAPTKSFVIQSAKCKEDDLPVVFVAGNVVGTFHELVQWDVSGRLTREVYGVNR